MRPRSSACGSARWNRWTGATICSSWSRRRRASQSTCTRRCNPGSDSVLRRMHRKYRPRHYEERVRKARASMPDAAIGADVMTGFPGETDEEFEESRAFIESLPFTYLHVFTYSERPGTPAAANTDQVPHRNPQRAQPDSARAGCAQESGVPAADDRADALGGDAGRRRAIG